MTEVVHYYKSSHNLLCAISHFSMENDQSIHCSKQDPLTNTLNDFFGWIANAEYMGKQTIENLDVIVWAAEVIFHIFCYMLF